MFFAVAHVYFCTYSNWIELEILQYYDTAARKEIEFAAEIIYIFYPSNNHMPTWYSFAVHVEK